MTLDQLRNVKPNEVSLKIPARLVVGMSSCQMSRVQAWLEAFLTPLSKLYGDFEYTKDSTDILIDFKRLSQVATEEAWNFDDLTMFGIDVQALYPSVNFEFLKLALDDCLNSCTDWSSAVKETVMEIIMYTLENQQVSWNGVYYMLNKGIPTGGKHCVPLANIFLSYILKDLLKHNPMFRSDFEKKLKLWRRFIDDCGGVYVGDGFANFFKVLSEHFKKFDLQLTHETSNVSLKILDIEIYTEDSKFHTKEFRKETASNSYVKFGSAHPTHCFKGIVKSQLTRLRRLCSKDSDFMEAVDKLRDRCLNSGYDADMVHQILANASTMKRVLTPDDKVKEEEFEVIRWVVLAGTGYLSRMKAFVNRLNKILRMHRIKLELVMSTGLSIGRSLFNNNVKSPVDGSSCSAACHICTKGVRMEEVEAVSPTNGRSYPVNKNLRCTDRGIYTIACSCTSLYTGKTSTSFSQRFSEHFKSPSSAVYDHSNSCSLGGQIEDFSVQFLENMYSRGKYSLSEREYLWNERLRGALNIQKTLKR